MIVALVINQANERSWSVSACEVEARMLSVEAL